MRILTTFCLFLWVAGCNPPPVSLTPVAVEPIRNQISGKCRPAKPGFPGRSACLNELLLRSLEEYDRVLVCSDGIVDREYNELCKTEGN